MVSCKKCGKELIKKGMFSNWKDEPHPELSELCGACGKDEYVAHRATITQTAHEESKADSEERARQQREELELKEKESAALRNMQLLSIETIPADMKPLGLVRGSTARSKNAISDLGAGLKSIVGGELVAYTKLMADAREQAIQRMKEDAVRMGAEMIVGVRFSSATVDVGAAEIIAWGTALGRREDG